MIWSNTLGLLAALSFTVSQAVGRNIQGVVTGLLMAVMFVLNIVYYVRNRGTRTVTVTQSEANVVDSSTRYYLANGYSRSAARIVKEKFND